MAAVITGAGIISALGIGKEQTLEALLANRSGIREPRILNTLHKHLPMGEVHLSDTEMCQLLGVEDNDVINRTALMGAIACREAMNEAKLPLENAEKIELICGTTVGGMTATERYFKEMQSASQHLSVLATHDCGATTDIIAHAIGLKGCKTTTISTACSSALNAIIMGAKIIQEGKADYVIAGGSEALTLFHVNGFNSLMILDEKTCKPFDISRKGLNLGEGAAFVIIESEENARKRGVDPLAHIGGYGISCDAYHQTASSSDGEGATLAMTEALKTSGLKAQNIDYINAHGTGTPNNDKSESAALMRVFGNELPPTSSTKGYTGHTTSASGSIETVICLLAMQNDFIPASYGCTIPDPECIIPQMTPVRTKLVHVMCNSFGFGGNDSALILSSDDKLVNETTNNRPEIFVHALVNGPTDNLRDFVTPIESRRMGTLLKSALATSLTALREAQISIPDEIITGTTYGMLEGSEKFLIQLCENGEKELSPTLFMQSTHNTIGGLLAIKTKCHGYNITITQGERTLECILDDARRQLQINPGHTILVSYHDETTKLFAELAERASERKLTVGVKSIALVLSTRKDGALCNLNELKICGNSCSIV